MTHPHDDLETLCLDEIGIDPEIKSYRLLVKAYEIPEQTMRGVLLPESVRHREQYTHNIGRILKIGSTAFAKTDHSDFSDRKCNVGDWIAYSSYEREQFRINGHLCFIINDEKIYMRIKPEDVPAFMKELG